MVILVCVTILYQGAPASHSEVSLPLGAAGADMHDLWQTDGDGVPPKVKLHEADCKPCVVYERIQ